MEKLSPSMFPRFAKAVASNQFARLFPAAYVRLTGQTGRGNGDAADPQEIASYFRRCLDDYRARLERFVPGFDAWLHGKRVLEYGPGDVLGVALLMRSMGAEEVCCVDQFPLVNPSELNVSVYRELMDGLDGLDRTRAAQVFMREGEPDSGLSDIGVRYRVTRRGTSDEAEGYDLVISRAVLEHVEDLPALFEDMYRALKPGCIAIHQVDLRSHGLDRAQALDFLEWPDWAYRAMYGKKGFPNRERIDTYRRLISDLGFECVEFVPTELLSPAAAERARRLASSRFRLLSAEDMAWLGFWMIVRKPDMKS